MSERAGIDPVAFDNWLAGGSDSDGPDCMYDGKHDWVGVADSMSCRNCGQERANK